MASRSAAAVEATAAAPIITDTAENTSGTKRLFSALTYTYLVASYDEDTKTFRRIAVIPGESRISEADHALLAKDKGYQQRRDDGLISDSKIAFLGDSVTPGQLFVQNKDMRVMRHISQALRNPDLREEKRAIEEAASKTGG